jgi:hypothetical protein
MNFMTKEKIKELLQGVYSGWKDIDLVVNEIHDTLSSVTLPPITEENTEEKDE